MSLNIKAYVMLVLASIFWAGNFIIGKFAFIENISPFEDEGFEFIEVKNVSVLNPNIEEIDGAIEALKEMAADPNIDVKIVAHAGTRISLVGRVSP